MSRLLGAPGERWPLAGAIDVLADCVRRAAVPSWLWLACWVYPSFELSLNIVGLTLALVDANTALELPSWLRVASAAGTSGTTGLLGVLFARVSEGDIGDTIALAFAVAFSILGWRFTVGLASVAPVARWDEARGSRRSVRLGAIWRAGRGLTAPALGLWIGLQLVLFAAILFVIGPITLLVNTFHLDVLGAGALPLVAPAAVLLLLYAIALAALNLLAIPSLVLHRRGAASALIHAWRLVQNDPWATMRAALADLLLAVSILLLQALTFAPTCCLSIPILAGIAGMARAFYWSRVYTALGGIEPIVRAPPAH
jgi:hypothetical protein